MSEGEILRQAKIEHVYSVFTAIGDDVLSLCYHVSPFFCIGTFSLCLSNGEVFKSQTEDAHYGSSEKIIMESSLAALATRSSATRI